MSGVRPSDYPPPFSPAEAIAPPTDPADERIEVGVLVVVTPALFATTTRMLYVPSATAALSPEHV